MANIAVHYSNFQHLYSFEAKLGCNHMLIHQKNQFLTLRYSGMESGGIK